jgi:hypothetical protein
MADYYSLLSKAVSNLPKSGAGSARQAIYARARAALLRQLRSLGPSLLEADIAREEASLESAIARLEGQYAPAPPAAATPDVSAPSRSAPMRPSAPASPTVAAEPASTRAPDAPPRPSSRAAPVKPDAPPRAPAPPMRAAPPRSTLPPTVGASQRPSIGAEASARPILGARPASSGARLAPPPPSAHRASAIPAPPIVAMSGGEPDAESPAPPIDRAAELDRAAYAPAGADGDSIRPSAPSRIDAPRANPLPWILLAVIVGIVLSVAVAAFVLRQKPQDLAIKEPPEAADSQPAAPAAKIPDRVGGATATPTPAPTPAPASSIEATPTAAAPTPTPVASSPASATAAPQPAATPGLPVAARAAMLVAVAADPQKPPAVSLGSVVWTSIPPIPGQPATFGVKAEADIPDLKMHAVMTIHKNTDPSLPATHTIDLRVTFGDGAEIKGIKDMRVPMMRRDDPPAQDALSGVRVKISDNYFLVGLNRADADAARNVDLIATRAWFDFPLLLNDDRIAKLTFEKGADGDRIVAEAMAAWKAP